MNNSSYANKPPAKRWIEPAPLEVPAALQEAVGGHPLVAQTLFRRGVTTIPAARSFLDPDAYTPVSGAELPDLEKAADILEAAIQAGKLICVWGDFDVDGQTATTLLVTTLQDLGARVTFHIPVRIRETHGLNLPVLEQLIDQGIELLLTCDTGISDHEAVAYAKSRAIPILVTDHHDLPPTLPDALALVNPKRLPEGHPLGTLPGVGVAYKLAEELYRRAGRPEASAALLDLVALGIVADLALLQGEARYLLQRGLQALRQTRRLGLQAMLELAEIAPQNLAEEHISFVLGPRLNALGRLSDANRVVELLTTQDMGRARILALELEGMNAERKLLTDQVFQAAQAQIEADRSLLDEAVLVLAHPTWPAGVVGIVASRLVEHYHRPVILLSAPPGQAARGSARSVDGINITAAIAANQHLLIGFGGHPMAAGLSIEAERLPEFRRALSRTVRQMGGSAQPEISLPLDGYLPLSALNLDFVADLERLAPFGPGNPPLILASRGLSLSSSSAVGRNSEHLQLTVEDENGVAQRLIWWQGAGWPQPEGRFDLAYTVRASTYRGQRDVQVEWVDFRPIEEAVPTIRRERQAMAVLDYRAEPHPLPLLQRLAAEQPGIQVWCEASALGKIDSRDRNHLAAGTALAIWSIPPGPAELRAVLKRVNPETVYLFAVDPNMDQPEPFLKRLAGLLKYAIRVNQGSVLLSVLAAATAQRLPTIRAGLAWLEANHHFAITRQEGDQIWVVEETLAAPSTDAQQITAQLKALLDESAAYRVYFAHASKDSLVNPPAES